MNVRTIRTAALAALLVASTLAGTRPADASYAGTVRYKVAVILYGFSDWSSQPITAAQVKDMVFQRSVAPTAAGGSINSYYDEVTEGSTRSTGHLSTSGDVFGWYTLDRSLFHPDDGRKYACPGPDEDDRQARPLLPEVRNRAANDGFNLANYDFVIYASNVAECNASWKGNKTVLGAAMDTTNWTAWAHELGHGLGLNHANKADCVRAGTRVTWDGACTDVEYGDGFSVMGADWLVGHFSAFDKLKLRAWWMGPDVLDVRRSGTYALKPVTDGTGGIRGLRIETHVRPANTNGGSLYAPADDVYYYVEYRTSAGFNATSQSLAPVPRGVTVRVAKDFSHAQKPLLLDMDPSDDRSWTLPSGVWYHDQTSGVGLRVVPGSQTDQGVRIDVVRDERIDLDGDGRDDLVFHRPDGSGAWNTVPTLRANGDGTWRDVNPWSGTRPHATGVVAVPGYFDADDRLDVLFHRPGSNETSVWVVYGDGNGGWASTVSRPVPSWVNQPGVVAIPGHFNPDAMTDVAFHRPGGGWNSVPVLLANGSGGFTGTNYVAPSWANQPGVVAVPGTFNGDGLTDIAFHRPGSTWNSLPVLFARGDGSWASSNFIVPSWANQPGVVAIAGRFNFDGLTDIAFHRPGGGWATVPVLLARGDGSWIDFNRPAPGWANQPGVVAIAGRFNADGMTDIAFHRPGGGWNSVPLLMARGDGSWDAHNWWAPSWANQPGVVAVAGRFAGDALTDIAFHRPGSTWNTVPVLSARTGGGWGNTNVWAPSWANQPGVVAVRPR